MTKIGEISKKRATKLTKRVRQKLFMGGAPVQARHPGWRREALLGRPKPQSKS